MSSSSDRLYLVDGLTGLAQSRRCLRILRLEGLGSFKPNSRIWVNDDKPIEMKGFETLR